MSCEQGIIVADECLAQPTKSDVAPLNALFGARMQQMDANGTERACEQANGMDEEQHEVDADGAKMNETVRRSSDQEETDDSRWTPTHSNHGTQSHPHAKQRLVGMCVLFDLFLLF